MGYSFNPFDMGKLSPQVLITNIPTGELWEIIKIEELSILMKSVSRNSVTSFSVAEIKQENWLICDIE